MKRLLFNTLHQKYTFLVLSVYLVCVDHGIIGSPVGNSNTGSADVPPDYWKPGTFSARSPVSSWMDAEDLPESSFVLLQQRANEKLFLNGNGDSVDKIIKIRPEYNNYNLVTKSASNENSNVFIFCLMFLFGLIMCGLVWCLCAASRNLDRDPTRRSSSRFSR